MFFLLAKNVVHPTALLSTCLPPSPKSRFRLGYETCERPAVPRDQFLSELNEDEVADENRRVEKQVLEQVGL